MRTAWILALALGPGLRTAAAQLVFDANFDNGHLDSAVQDGPDLWTVAPPMWLHFRITGAVGAQPTLRLEPGSGSYVYRSSHRMVFRYEGHSNWHLMDEGYLDGVYYYFRHGTPFTEDTVYLAYWYPWTWGQMQDKMTQIMGSPFVRNAGPRGYSPEGRPVYGLELTDPRVPDACKQHVVIISRQHQYESLGSHISRGLGAYLAWEGAAEADALRRTAVVHLYPMAMPDQVYHGQTGNTPVDPNRDWWPGPPSGTPSLNPEIHALREDIMASTGGTVTYGFDIHSHGGHLGPYYYWGLKTGPPEMVAKAAALVQAIHTHDALDHGGVAIVSSTIAQDMFPNPKPTASYWLFDTMGAVSYTFEPGSVPPQTRQRITDVGHSIAKGLADVLPGVPLGDMNCDGVVNADDLAARAGCFDGPGSPVPAGCEPADLDLDGDADVADFAALQLLVPGGRTAATFPVR
jgi:hypothetical protein